MTVRQLDLLSSIKRKLRRESPSAASYSIFRVPELIRRHNVEAYTPNVVSIGPFHKGGRPQFQFMQDVKGWYLQCLLTRCPSDTLENLIDGVTKLVDSARNSYDQKLELLSLNDFVEIMVLDGCFLLELFTRTNSDDLRDENDPIFNQNYMLEFLRHDLLLLENQIPWFVLKCLHYLTTDWDIASLFTSVGRFFQQQWERYHYLGEYGGKFREALHILDLIRSALVNLDDSDTLKEERPLYRLYGETRGKPLIRIPSATTLEESGFKFDKSWTIIKDVKFEGGVLRIPVMNIDEITEALLRNMIALEQCHHDRPHMITSYAFLMDNLIHSAKDIDLLCNKGIITVNRLSNEDASKMFCNLCKDTALDKAQAYHVDLFTAVIKHYKTPWKVSKDTFRKWMQHLKRDYFSTPWKVISWIAAFILLILTLLQTLYTLKQYYNLK